MRLGLLADIHEEIELLPKAIDLLQSEGVDRFLFLGDLVGRTTKIEETVAIMDTLKSVGVWGNHDIGLCRDVSEDLRSRYSQRVLGYMGSLLPKIELDGNLYQHIEPHLDPESFEDLWTFSERGDLDLKAVFEKPYSRMIIGHIHTWAAYTPHGRLDWDGTTPLYMDSNERYYVIIHAIVKGYCALFDTDTQILTPYRVG